MTEQTLSEAEKEQTKLRATFLNNIGIGVILVGVFTPAIRAVYGEGTSTVGLIWAAGSPVGCFLLGMVLHLMATRLLGRLG
jgi:hypothetical protein